MATKPIVKKGSIKTQPTASPHPAAMGDSTLRGASKAPKAELLIKEIRRNTRPIFTSEQKVIIIMEGIRGEVSVAELCRKYGISTQTYYTWNKEFIEAGKRQLSGDIVRQATSGEVAELKAENTKLKESLADLVLRYDIVKKSLRMLE